MLIDTTPQQLKFEFALWTRKAVKQLILKELDVNIPISTIRHYLKKWEFTSKNQFKRHMKEKIVLLNNGLKKITLL